ncbi:hypothetical protein BDV12DRAFT_203096 [Aspergillus spectabilis]
MAPSPASPSPSTCQNESVHIGLSSELITNGQWIPMEIIVQQRIMILWNLSHVGTTVLMTVKNHNMGTKVGLLISYYITLSFWSAQNLDLSMVSRNISGATKKFVAIAATFVSWAVGNAIGPQVFLDQDAPRYFIAFGVHLGCYVCLMIAVIFLRWYLSWQNRKKERMLAEAGLDPNEQNLAHAFEDRTDQENLYFRYIY